MRVTQTFKKTLAVSVELGEKGKSQPTETNESNSPNSGAPHVQTSQGVRKDLHGVL